MSGRVGVWASLLAVCLASAYLVLTLDSHTVERLTEEDGAVENLQALMFFASSLIFFAAYRLSRHRDMSPRRLTRGSLFLLLLGVMFLFATLEEVSWGQRIFQVDSPSFFQQHNRLRQINLHNLEWFNKSGAGGEGKGFLGKMLSISRLFSLFWLFFCVLLPLLHRRSTRVRRVMERLKIPLVPLFLGTLLLLNYFASKWIEVSRPHLHSAGGEIKEFNIAVVFLVVAVVEFLRMRSGRPSYERRPGR